MRSVLIQLVQGRALLFIIVLGLGGSFQIGCHVTLISSPSPFIQSFINSSWSERYGEPPGEDTLTLIWATLVSIYSIGGLFGTMSVSYLLRCLGRNKAMICANMLNIAGVAIMVVSKDANSFEMIMLSRFLFGVTSGLVRNIHPIYLGESTPKKIRGTVSVTLATFASIGKLMGQIAGLGEILGREHLWNILLCVPAFFSFVHLMMLPFFPEAPRYLLIEKGKTEKCRKAMQRLWGPGDYKLEIEEMQLEQAALKGQRSRSVFELLRDPKVRWQSLSLIIFQEAFQFCGITGISLFAYSIFMEAGIPVDKIRYVTLGVGVSEILTSIMCNRISSFMALLNSFGIKVKADRTPSLLTSPTSSLLIDRVGRRVLVWGGFGIMSVIMLLLSITLLLKDYDCWVPYTTVGLVFLFVICYGGGPAGASVPLFYEMFVQSDRTAAFTLDGVLKWGTSSVFGFVFPLILGAMKSFSFLMFACVCFVTSLYAFFILPETKGKTPLEIAEEFRKIRVCSSPAKDTRLETKL